MATELVPGEISDLDPYKGPSADRSTIALRAFPHSLTGRSPALSTAESEFMAEGTRA